jgi:hypothetical protein
MKISFYILLSTLAPQWRGFATRAFTCLGFQPSFLFISSNTYLQ